MGVGRADRGGDGRPTAIGPDQQPRPDRSGGVETDDAITAAAKAGAVPDVRAGFVGVLLHQPVQHGAPRRHRGHRAGPRFRTRFEMAVEHELGAGDRRAATGEEVGQDPPDTQPPDTIRFDHVPAEGV